jgi:hypothetical protein
MSDDKLSEWGMLRIKTGPDTTMLASSGAMYSAGLTTGIFMPSSLISSM